MAKGEAIPLVYFSHYFSRSLIHSFSIYTEQFFLGDKSDTHG